ncbi:MAG: Holliday junction branch migration protein RuvA [Myxococcaceae bacterium]
MIAHLRGAILEKNLTDAVVDVNGVGYRVHLSLLTMARLPETGQPVTLRVQTVVREDALDLYGFLQRDEEELYLLLNSVSQIGPKAAINVLSGLEVEELKVAITKGDVARLTKIRGVGKKTAERIVLELKEKVKLMGAAEPVSGAKKPLKAGGAMSDLVSALVNLGYREAQAQQAAQLAEERAGADAAFELLFREALKSLRTT